MSTFVEKVMGAKAGTVVTINPDYVVINDGVSAAAVKEIKAVAVPDKVLVIYDHDVPTGRPEAAAILRQNLMFADKYGCKYIQAEGIGYQYMLNTVVKPGQIIIGGGSHSSIFGAKGALGLDVSIPELARCVETGRYSCIVPETIYVSLEGVMAEGIGAMDVALTLLQKNLQQTAGKAIEIYAPGLDNYQQAILCSMVCKNWAVTAAISKDKPTSCSTLDLSTVQAMVMLPCAERNEQSRAKIVPLTEVKGTKVQAGQIGGYTCGTIEILRKAAAMIKGKKIALGFRLTICPATSKDYIAALEEGIITDFIDYGAQISAAGDHSVVVQGAGAMGHGEKLLTTGLYTFKGAMGCEDVEIYSASMESVVAASQTKQI